ncbi:MAG: HipA domain-containing protein [Myxococcota bacterium]
MPPALDHTAIRAQIASETAAWGPLSQQELANRLGVSQPTISRALRNYPRALRVQRGPAARVLIARDVHGVGHSAPVFRVDEHVRLVPDGTLYPVFDHGFFWEWLDGTTRLFQGWPYLLDPLRPSGFLGACIASQHPELQLPTRIADCTDDDLFRFATKAAWNMPGDRIVGIRAQQRFLEATQIAPRPLAHELRVEHARRVDDVLGGDPGSLVDGQQPKFVSYVRGRACIVKFSPSPDDDPSVAQRWADLLVSEHLALQTLREHGLSAAHTAITTNNGRVFLEIERCDRVGEHGRRGVLSLHALAAEFAEAPATDWRSAANELVAKGLFDPDHVTLLARLQTFGRLIGNIDMHLGNASVFLDGRSVRNVTPAYDMLPMLWAPSRDTLPHPDFEPVPAALHERPHFPAMCDAALDFWNRVQRDARISPSFRDIATQAFTRLTSMTGTFSAGPPG